MIRKEILSAYVELTKPRILSLVLITTALGFFLGGKGIQSWERLLILLSGVSLVCGGSAALNHYLERDVDKLMERTKNRPIPQGVIKPNEAMLFGIVLVLLGVFILWGEINLLTAFLSLLTAFLYVLVYTPMKKMTWLNTTIGAIPGALPPLGGWAAATNDLSTGGWILFLILFLWQHPHFYSIAWIFREDYKRGGLKMLPVVYPDGKSTFLQIIIFSILLIPASLLPTLTGMSGKIYFSGVLISGVIFLMKGILLTKTKSMSDAKAVLRTSIIYLPLLFFLIVLDVSF